MNTCQLLLGESFLAQRVETVLVRLAAADRADVARVLREHRAQRWQVELGIVRQDDDIGRTVDRDLAHRFVGPGDHQLIGFRKTLFGGELRAGVDHRHAISHQLRKPVQRDRDVDRADDHEVGRAPERLHENFPISPRELGPRGRARNQLRLAGRQVRSERRGLVAIQHPDELPVHLAERLHENLDVTAARQPDLERHVVGHAEGGDLRRARLQDLLPLLKNGALDAPVRNRAGHLARAGDQHLRTERPRARAPRLDHRRDGDVLAVARPLVELLKYFSHLDFRESSDASSRPRSSSACTLWAVRKSSQWGSAAAMPRVSGS